MAPTPRPISLRLPPDLLADIDNSVATSPQPNRTAWITEACRQRLNIEAAMRGGPVAPLSNHVVDDPDGTRDMPHPYEPLGENFSDGFCRRCGRDSRHVLHATAEAGPPATVQQRAGRGEPGAVARMLIAGELNPDYLTEAGLGHLAELDPDGDIEGADYPPEPEPVPPCAGATLHVEVVPIAGGAMWRWKVDHPDLDGRPVEGSESLYSPIEGNARRLVAARVGHSNFTLTMPRRPR